MVFRRLTEDEIHQEVWPDFRASGNPLPDPRYSVFVGLFESELLAYLCLQLKLHAQPLVIRDGQSHLFPRLVHEAENYIAQTVGESWIYLFTPEGKLTQMGEAMGLTLEPWNVLSKHIEQASSPVLPGVT